MPDLKEKTVEQTKTPPSTRWRNRYYRDNEKLLFCRRCGVHEVCGPGEYLSCTVYPSKELAEQGAIEFHANNKTSSLYMGAVECED